MNEIAKQPDSIRFWPPDSVRNMGIYLVASKGSGKSRAMGRWLAKQDCLRGIPQVILDPVGGTIDNLLDCLSRLPADHQAVIWPRIRYVDMGAQDAVVPFPLYYRLGESDTMYQISQRFLDVLRLLDPDLTSASVEGWNALWQCGTYVGMVLAALDCQIVDAPSLLSAPKHWKSRLNSLLNTHPDTATAVHWLTDELPRLKPDLQLRRTSSFLQKVTAFTLEASSRAMFGASQPGIDWQEVIEQGQTVLFDFRHVLDTEQRRFRMMWVLFYFLEVIKTRGAGRHRPVGLVIDEISALTNFDLQSRQDLFAGAIDELLNVWARQGQVWTTIAHQEVWQVSDRMLKTLMGCGTRILGRTSDMEAALTLAQELVPADPHRVKRYEPIYNGEGKVLGERPVEYSLDEQHYLAALLYKNLGKFCFVAKTLSGEGGFDTPLRPLSIEGLEPGVYPDDARVATIRTLLHRRTAWPVSTLLEEIRRRGDGSGVEYEQLKETDGCAIVPDKQHYDPDGYLLPPE